MSELTRKYEPTYDAVGDIDEARSHCEQWLMRHFSPEETFEWWNSENRDLDAIPRVMWNDRPQMVYRYIFLKYGR